MKKLLVGLVAVALLVPAISLAAYWKADENVSVSALQPVEENAYLAGNTVTISGAVKGDLFAAGNAVSVSGNISRDLFAAGSMVNIYGAKAEDVRVAGSNVNIGGFFTGELLAAGAQLTVTSDAQISKNVYLAGSVLVFNGKSAGDVTLSGEKVEVNGRVGGNLMVKSADSLTIGPDAVIQGNVEYSSPAEATIDPAAQISGKVNYTPMAASQARRAGARAAFLGFFTLVFLIKLLAILAAAYLLWYLRRKDSVDVVQHALTKFGAALLRGFIFLVVVPAGIVVLFFTVIGIPIGIFSLLLYVAFLMLACPFAALLTSSLLMKRKMDLQWYHILLGALVLTFLKLVPIIGWILALLVYLAALGALITVLRNKFKK